MENEAKDTIKVRVWQETIKRMTPHQTVLNCLLLATQCTIKEDYWQQCLPSRTTLSPFCPVGVHKVLNQGNFQMSIWHDWADLRALPSGISTR